MSDPDLAKRDVRKEAIKNLAYRLGGSYTEDDAAGILSLVRDLPLFRKGFAKKIRNVLHMEPQWGKVYLFDFYHTRHRGKAFMRYQRSVCFVNAKLLGLPEFKLRPALLFDKFIGLFSPQGIQFPDHKRFSKRYILTGENESMIRHYFREDVLDLLSERKDWHMEGLGYYLVLYGATRLAEGRELGRLLEDSLRISRLMIGNRYEAGWLVP